MLSYHNIIVNNLGVDTAKITNLKGLVASISKQLSNSNLATIIPADGFGDVSFGIKRIGNGEYASIS